jgi:hypothetical protein
MIFRKSILVLTVLLLASCHGQKLAHVWFYNEDDVEMLNGNVKQVFVGNDSLGNHQYKSIYFDEDRNIRQFNERSVYFTKSYGVADTFISTSRTKFVLQKGKAGNVQAIIGFYFDIDSAISDNHKTVDEGKSKLEFDKPGKAINFYPIANDLNHPMGVYKYNEKGDIIEYKKSEQHPGFLDTYTFVYDSDHHLVEKDLYRSDGLRTLVTRKTRFRYKSFDSNRNWTKLYKDEETHSTLLGLYWTDTVTRKITYY